jgi:putative oxidoreductase
MQTPRHWFNWAEAHPKVWLDLVRIYLGIGLFVRGLLIITNSHSDFVNEMLQRSGQSWLFTAAVLHYVALAHLVGGLMLTFGLLTRIAALVQIPILIGAIFFIHRGEGLMAASQSLEFSALVLFLLCVFVIAGAGPVSVDGEARVKENKPLPLDIPAA